MRKIKLFLSLLMVMLLSVGNVWATLPTSPKWEAKTLADIADGSTVIIISNSTTATNIALPAAGAGTGNPPKKACTVSTTDGVSTITPPTGTTLQDLAWTLKKKTSTWQFFVEGSTTNCLYLTGTSSNTALRVGEGTSNNEFVMGDLGKLLKVTTAARFVGPYDNNGSDWRTYNTENATNYKGAQLTFYVLKAAACTSEVEVTKGAETNGTYTLSDTKVCGDGDGGEITISDIEPADGYAFDKITATEGTVDNENKKVTGITANTTITVLFKELQKYTVSFNTGAGNPAVSPITETTAGAGITLPAGPTPACSADGWTFAGWAAAAVATETTTAPALLSGTYNPTDDVTLYAVYKRSEGGGSATVTITPSEVTGENDPYTLVHNQSAYTIQINKNGGTNPVINTTAKDARVYAKGTIVISNASPMTELVFNISTQGKKRLAPITASVGSIAAQSSEDETVTWTGNATSVTFTVGESAEYGSDGSSKAGQLDFDNITATAASSTTYYLSAPSCAAPTCEDLGTPSVTVTNKTYNSAKLTWAAVDNADKYLVKFNGVDQEATENLYFDATGLEAEETYTYQVKALAEEGQDDWCDGAFSAEANFTTEPAPAATLTLSENTVTHNLAGDHTLGETVTLPSADDCSKKFRGWSVNENCETEPELHAGDPYTLNATSQTLYAVYAKVMSVSDPSLTKLGSGATFADGDKLVIAAKGTNYAIYFENAGSAYVKNWEFAGDDPVLSELAESKKILTLVKSGDNWKFGDAINGYFYSSGSNNLEISTTNSSEFNSFVWNTTEEAFTITKTDSRYLNCRTDLTSGNANLWRFNGTNTNNGSPFLYVYKYSAGDATYGEWSTTCTAALDAPTFSVNPAEGPFDHELSVELTAAEGDIYYNINSADDPTSGSTPYTGAITVDACGSTTIKAIAISSTNQSAVASATYVLNLSIPLVSAEDPYTEAEAVEVYNSGCYNNEDVWVTGTVQTAQFYSSNTYTITLTNGFQFYYFYESFDGENLVPFSSDYIEAGDVLVAAGKLSKHNTTYQIANGYLVSRTPAPKTPIDSDIDNPISVAAAVNYIDNAATYDLSEDEFVAGIVESIAECSQHEGTYDIIVLDATDNTKQIKFFGCDVKTFAGIKQYDQITGKGKLFKYYSTYELNYPCEVVALTPYVAPVVDVTGVEVDETATVKVGKTVQLTANVLPANASNKNVTWSVKAGGEDYAEVSETGLVTGKAEGEAIIVVTTEDGSFTDECTVTVTGGINFAAGDFVLVEDAAELTEGTYVIVAGSGDNNAAMKYYAGSDNNHKAKAAIKEGKYLHYDSEFGVYEIKNYVVNEEVVGISFYNEDAENYFALPASSNQLKTSTEQNNNSSWTVAVSEGVTTLTNKAFTGRTLRYNSGASCFASYETGQKTIALYKYVTPAAYRVYYDDNVAEEEIEVPAYQSVDGENKVTITTVEPVRDGYLFGGWKDGEANVYEAGVEYTLSADLTLYAQWTTATVSTLSYNSNGGTLIDGETAIADADVAEGTNLTIEANVYEKGDNFVFAGWQLGDDVYQPGDPFVMPATDVEFVAKWDAVEVSDYALVTDLAQLQAGDKIIIVAADYNVAAGSQAATYRNPVTIGKTASKNNLILAGYSTPTEFTLGISDGKFSFNDGNGYMYENAEKSVKVQEDPYYWTISIDAEAIATITGTNPLLFNSNSGQERFTTYTSSQKALQLYRKPGDAPVYTTVREELNVGEYYTICLKNAVTAVQGGSIWRILSKAANGTDIILEEVEGALDAGRPYIFNATADKLEVICTGVAVDDPVTTGNNGLVGSFSQELIANVNTNYIIYNNELYYVNTDNVYVGAHRAYIDMTAVPDYSEPQQGNAPRRRVTMHTNAPQVATGMDELNASETPVKVMINGQMYILRGEQMYDATGRLVK